MNATLIDAFGWTLLHFLWQGALIAALTAAALRVLRHAAPQLRYNVACAGLLACLMWPAAELASRLRGDAASGATLRVADAMLTGPAGPGAGGLLSFLQHQMLWIVGCWTVCCLLLALRMMLGLAWIGKSARNNAGHERLQASVTRLASQFGVTRTLRLRIVDGLASPITAGWLRPVVLVPAALVSGMPHELLEALLAHEMAHVKRFDYLVNLGQNVIETVLFYHPAVWWISGRIRAEREQIADDIAARHTGQPQTLALALSELEKLQFSTHHLALAANGGDLVTRVRRLLRPAPQSLNWKAALPVFALVATCLSLYVHAAARPALAATPFPVRPPMLDFGSCVKPEYPAADLAAAHQGTVTLKFEVDSRGKIVQSSIDRSSGYPGLDRTALQAIRLCSARPATQDGKAVAAPMKMQYVWTLG